MKIFYHNDMDGKCAAHVVLSWKPKCKGDVGLFPMQYGMEFPFDDIVKDEVVYILDFSIEPEDMEKLLEITDTVIWIDHHKTGIAKYKDFRYISGITDVSYSGCVLAWQYFYEDEPPPEYIKLIGDRDTWTWKFGDRTKYFFAGIEAVDTSPNSEYWEMMREAPESFINEGKVIQRYKDIQQQDYILENGFWVEFHDHRCYAVNGRYSSQPFEACVPDAEIWLTFRYLSGGYWMVSLYSTKVDVSEIATQYEYHGKKGGGHKVAAGFECDYPPFLYDRRGQ